MKAKDEAHMKKVKALEKSKDAMFQKLAEMHSISDTLKELDQQSVKTQRQIDQMRLNSAELAKQPEKKFKRDA
jgi:hypothetical protein